MCRSKQRELKNYRKFDVIEVTNIEEATGNIIPTEWILIEMEKQDGFRTVEARLCLVGKTEKLLQKIDRKAPNPNNKSLKILLSLAVSQGWNIETSNIGQAFFQLDQSQCELFIKTPNRTQPSQRQSVKTEQDRVRPDRRFESLLLETD